MTHIIITFFLPILSQTMPQKRLPENEPTNTTWQKNNNNYVLYRQNQFLIQVTSTKLQIKLWMVLLAVTLSGLFSYPESRALKEALRYPPVKCLCCRVLPQGKACMCHFQFTFSVWSGAPTKIGILSVCLLELGTSAVGTMPFGSWYNSSTVPVGTQ